MKYYECIRKEKGVEEEKAQRRFDWVIKNSNVVSSLVWRNDND